MRISKLEALIEQYQNQLVKFIFYRIGSYEDALELVQNIYIKYYERSSESDGVLNPKSFLFTSAYNASVDFSRKRKLETISLDTKYSELVSTDKDLMDLEEESVRINHVLSVLPDNQSEIVRMRIIDEIPFNEIASIIEIPVATAKSRFKYGIEKLKMFYKLNELEVCNEL